MFELILKALGKTADVTDPAVIQGIKESLSGIQTHTEFLSIIKNVAPLKKPIADELQMHTEAIASYAHDIARILGIGG